MLSPGRKPGRKKGKMKTKKLLRVRRKFRLAAYLSAVPRNTRPKAQQHPVPEILWDWQDSHQQSFNRI